MTKRNKSVYRPVAIVIPAYNESENLKYLIPRIMTSVPGASVVIIDDSGLSEHRKTMTAVRNAAGVSVISRNGKQGRGSAVIAGIAAVLKGMPEIRYIAEMDADLAHDPQELPMLLAACRDADLVIGSRYLTESHIKDWPVRRLVQSKLINFFLNYWLGLAISDYTNGFRVYSRRAAEYIESADLRETGFISLSEVAFKIKKQGMTVTEVPISFTDRKYGRSNAGIRELTTSLMGAIRIRLSD